MQMRFKRENGYLTVYLSLVFAIILSLFLALVEGVAMGAARLQAELAADLGLDSVFAEYHRELFKQYGLLFIDDSYGTGKGSVSKIEEHLADYMSYNLNPKKGLLIAPGSNWVSLENVYLEIEEAAFATDNKGEVWKAQAIEYMKSRYGLDMIKAVQEQLQIIEKEQLLSGNMEEKLAKYKAEFEDTLETEAIEETDKKTQEGFSYDSMIDFFDSFAGKGILYLTVSNQGSISNAVMKREEYISHREQAGNINKGSGLPEYVEKPDSLIDELLFQEFLMEKYGCYTKEKKESLLKYQIEYILYGRDNDISNLRECAEHLFLLRSASNYLYLTTQDAVKLNEVRAVATAICSLLCLPELIEALTQMILVIWSMAEAIQDVKTLFEGGKVSLIKTRAEWKLGLSGIFGGGGKQNNQGTNTTQLSGISYEGYLRILLAVMLNRNDKTVRSMDIAEMDIRQTKGNESFRLDQCVDYLKVSFGFTGDRGQTYVFTRTMRYE